MSALPTLYYQEGYKYRVAKPFAVAVPELVDHPFQLRRFDGAMLAKNLGGVMEIFEYAWDGSSGPGGSLNDTKNSQIGTLVHDVCYQAGREGHLPAEARVLADNAMRRLFIEGGMWSARAWWMWKAVRLFAGYAYKHQPPDILTAP